jgi:hypothetical protein
VTVEEKKAISRQAIEEIYSKRNTWQGLALRDKQ